MNTFHFHALEKEMATHSSVLAWRIPEMGEPGGLPSMGSHRVRHDRSNLAAAAATTFEDFPGGASGEEPSCQRRRYKSRYDPWIRKIPQRRIWQPTTVFLPGESPWTEEPGRLKSTGSRRAGHDWNDLACMQWHMVWSIFPNPFLPPVCLLWWGVY